MPSRLVIVLPPVSARSSRARTRSPCSHRVFAPTNEVLAKLSAGTVKNLQTSENTVTLVATLTFHALPDMVLSADSAGKALHVTTVQGANGVIHASDAVIMPLTVA